MCNFLTTNEKKNWFAKLLTAIGWKTDPTPNLSQAKQTDFFFFKDYSGNQLKYGLLRIVSKYYVKIL